MIPHALRTSQQEWGRYVLPLSLGTVSSATLLLGAALRILWQQGTSLLEAPWQQDHVQSPISNNNHVELALGARYEFVHLWSQYALPKIFCYTKIGSVIYMMGEIPLFKNTNLDHIDRNNYANHPKSWGITCFFVSIVANKNVSFRSFMIFCFNICGEP
jgi:hypothetical protein